MPEEEAAEKKGEGFPSIVTGSPGNLQKYRFLGTTSVLGFPGGSAGKESACNAGDPGTILGSGRSPGVGIGYPVQYSWVSLVAQLVQNLPAMQETWV